jgi:tetratricopeptide (TPR) repeat protein
MFHLYQGDGTQGEAALIKAVTAAPEIMNSRLMLVTHYLRQKNYTAAIKSLQEGMNGSKADALLYNYLAAAYFSQRNNPQAIDALNLAKKSNPDYLTPYFNLASYFGSESEYEKAIAEYKNIITRDADNLRALLGLAAIYRLQGNDAEVANLYAQIETAGTEEAFMVASSYHYQLKNLSEALATVNRGLGIFPDSAPLLERKGGLYWQLGQAENAEKAYIELSGMKPEQGNRLLVALYKQSKQLEKAERIIESALKSDAHKDYPYLLSAGHLMSQDKVDDVLSILKKGIDSVKNNLRLQMQLASIYASIGKAMQAESIYQGILEKSPRFAPVYTSLGFLKEREGDIGRALDYYRTAIKYDQKDIASLNNAAYLLVDNFGQPKEALELAMNAYRLKPDDPRIMDTLGYVLLKSKRPGDAKNLLERAAEMLPDNPVVKLHLAMAMKDNGNKAEAKDLLNQVLKTGSESDVAQAEKILKSL